MRERITLDELKSFVAVYEAGSISRASDELGVMPSTISRSLTRLESKLNTSLILRNTRNLEFTHEGLKLIEYARSISATIDDIECVFRSVSSEPSGTLRINGASPVLVHLVSPIVKIYSQKYPKVKVHLQNNEEVVDIIEKKSDIAIRVGEINDTNYGVSPIGVSKRRLLASPSYLKEYGFPQKPEDFKNHILLGLDGPSVLNTWPILDNSGNPTKISPNIIASSGEVLRKLALEGAGIACITDFMTNSDRNLGKLVEVMKEDIIYEMRELNAIYHSTGIMPPKVSAFINLLQKESSHLL
ncbi:LysR family transcriptional regulator [Ferrimonas sediminum]|uniref:LysR family transcriptional regulator n=1 Tax=Ferrimonas sediminum TaxID=718193 RepID=UPI00159F8B37|nr:LysR family transcriptional regulator [Ferrimonas sediminum]